MKSKIRNKGLDQLRILCMMMLAVYHIINFYKGNVVDIYSFGWKVILVQNIFWGGGRLICNVFLMISAWFLSDTHFRVERIIRAWLTTLLYSIICGVYICISTQQMEPLIKSLFPISNASVWYVSAYIGVLVLSPLLNTIIHKTNLKSTCLIIAAIFFFESVIPTFYPKGFMQFSYIGWFSLEYIFIGIIKKKQFNISKFVALVLFICGWAITLGFYNVFDYLNSYELGKYFFEAMGFYKSVYFACLSSIPCFASALGLFFFFLNKEKCLIPGGILQKHR